MTTRYELRKWNIYYSPSREKWVVSAPVEFLLKLYDLGYKSPVYSHDTSHVVFQRYREMVNTLARSEHV